MEDSSRRTRITLLAIILAAIAVVGVLGFGSGLLTFPTNNTSPEIAVVSPTPLPTVPPASRIAPEAATSETMQAPVSSPTVAGVTTSAPTGPAENILALFGLLVVLGLGGNLVLAKFV